MRTVPIDIIRKRLDSELGIYYYWMGGSIIRAVVDNDAGVIRTEPLHYSVSSESQAAACEAHKVLRHGERLARKWDKWGPTA